MCRTWDSDRPFLSKCKFSGASVTQLNGYNWFEDSVITIRSCFDNGSFCDIRRNHGFMEYGRGLLCFCDDRARTYNVSFFYSNM